ncbi:MAG: outer membrane protein transport protein [Chlamydiia bacterium]|nr:outer membrane protein transport protein [Chlamydiia bacterium]
MKKFILSFWLILLNVNVHGLLATHGTFPIGWGTKSVGMGGVAVAYPQDTLVAATNPAGMYFVPYELDVGGRLFSPIRNYSYTTFGGDDVWSGARFFLIPHLGYTQKLGGCGVAGLSLYGYGGMNTKYPRNNPVFGQEGMMGGDYAILIVAPSYSFPLLPDWLCCHSIGISPLIAAQRIDIAGLENFRSLSSDPANVTNNGYDWAIGIGVRLGWMGQIFPSLFCAGPLWVGASYSTQVLMTRFPKYNGLFAQRGRLNVPAHYTVGMRWELTPCLNIAYDYQRILFGGVRAFGNGIESIFEGVKLGEKKGAGFGWKDIGVSKVGVDYCFCNCLQVRTGGSFGPIPYSNTQMDFNIIAPAVTRYHWSLGATWFIGECQEFDVAYSYAFKQSIKGQSRFGLGEIKHQMYQNLFEVNYSWRF